MAIESVVTNPAELTLTFMGRWTWDTGFHDDGKEQGERHCGHFSAYVIGRNNWYKFFVFDERIEGDPIYESSHEVPRRRACNLATRELRYRSERDATHRLVSLGSVRGLRRPA